MNMTTNLNLSERSFISSMSKANQSMQNKIKFLKNVQLQIIAQALNSKGLNLRQHVRVYHCNQIPQHLHQELEVLKLSDFLAFLREQGVLQFAGDDDQGAREMVEDMLTQLEALSEVEHLGAHVVLLDKLLQGLQAFGYQDIFQKPRSRKGFEFERLDVKSIRILNRLSQQVFAQVQRMVHQFGIKSQLKKSQLDQFISQILEQ